VGRLLALYLVWYGIGRAFLETIRLDPAELILGVRVNIWGALFAVLLGVILFIRQGYRHPGLEPSAYLPGKEWEPESAVDSDDDYYSTDDIVGEADMTARSRESTTS
jgi:Prolipoprotein diacylglyceryltransferase